MAHARTVFTTQFTPLIDFLPCAIQAFCLRAAKGDMGKRQYFPAGIPAGLEAAAKKAKVSLSAVVMPGVQHASGFFLQETSRRKTYRGSGNPLETLKQPFLKDWGTQ